MTTEPTTEAPPPAIDLAAFTASTAPVLEVPPGTSTPIARMLVDACRRVAVRLKDGRVLAVRPDPKCRKCHGSTTYRVRTGADVLGCVCVQRRALRFGHDVSSAPDKAKKPDASDKPAPVSDDRAARLAELEARIRDMEAQRDATLAAPTARLEDATASASAASARRAMLITDAAALDDEAEAHRRILARYEALAAQERADLEALSTAAAEKRNSVTGMDVEINCVNASMQEAEAERQRVIARWDDRMAPTRRAVARLRRKMGLPDSDKSAGDVAVTPSVSLTVAPGQIVVMPAGDDFTFTPVGAGPLLSPWEDEGPFGTGSGQVRRYAPDAEGVREMATSADDGGLWAYWRVGQAQSFASGTVDPRRVRRCPRRWGSAEVGPVRRGRRRCRRWVQAVGGRAVSRKPKYLTGACPRCIARGKTWKGYNPKCAFKSGTFDGDNWNCATMNALRDSTRAPRGVLAYNGDDDTCAVLVLPETDDRAAGFVVLSWYKSHGQVNGAFAMVSYQPVPLTLEMAEAAIGYADEVERMKSLVAQVRP